MAGETLARRVPFRTLGSIVNEGEKGLIIHSGKFTREVGPGRYFLSPVEEIVAVDITNKTENIEQHMIAPEGYPLVFDAAITYRVRDARTAAANLSNLPAYIDQVVKAGLVKISNVSTLEDSLIEPENLGHVVERLSKVGLEVVSMDVFVRPQEPYAALKLEEYKTVRLASIKLAEEKVGIERAKVEVERTKVLQEKRLVCAKTDIEIARQRQQLQLEQLEKSYESFAKFASSLKETYGVREARNIITTLFDPNIGQSTILPVTNAWGATNYQVFRYKPRAESLDDFDRELSSRYGTD